MVAVVMQPLQTLPVHPPRLLATRATDGSREAFPDPRDVIGHAPRLNWLKGLWLAALGPTWVSHVTRFQGESSGPAAARRAKWPPMNECIKVMRTHHKILNAPVEINQKVRLAVGCWLVHPRYAGTII